MRGIEITKLQELETLDGDEVAVVVIDPLATPINQKLLVRKLLTRAQVMFTVPGTLSVDTDVAPWFECSLPDGIEILDCSAIVKTAPTGTAVLFEVHLSTDSGGTWNEAVGNNINAGDRVDADVASISISLMDQGDLLRLDITQVGSTVAGADITVSVWVRPR